MNMIYSRHIRIYGFRLVKSANATSTIQRNQEEHKYANSRKSIKLNISKNKLQFLEFNNKHTNL